MFTTDTTGNKMFDRMMYNHTNVNIIMMSPKEYIERVLSGFNRVHLAVDFIRGRTDDLVLQYRENMLSGDVFPMVVLDYSKDRFIQDGIHRGIAAHLAEIEEIPVIVFK
jgi:hypothetical protein